jgi:hypothetical protein
MVWDFAPGGRVMRERFLGISTFAAVLSLALSAVGQVSGSRTKPVTTGNHAQAARLPYTAEYKISDVKTLANGATITHESTEVRSLDSEGRVMTSRTDIPVSEDQTARTFVQVTDPVARTNSHWDSRGQKVTVTAMPAVGTRLHCPAVATPPTTVKTPEPVMEDLGSETILGLEARGSRTTWTTPAGMIGNDAPLTRTIEMWSAIAPGLQGLLVRQLVDDPQSGKMDKELVNLNQSEPDASVFQPPAGYEIVNKDAPQVQCAAAQSAPAPAPSPQ